MVILCLILDIDKKCQPYFGKIVAPETEFLMTLQDRKIKILNQLNATRKDKASDKRKESASDVAIEIFQKVKELERNQQVINISDLDFDEDGEVIEVTETKTSEVQTLINPGGDNNGRDGEENT